MKTETVSHTPGPWIVVPRHPGFIRDAIEIRLGAIGSTVATVSAPVSQFHQAEVNARLMAAAPELLEALKRILHAAELAAMTEDMHFARAAIAKAEGRTP